MMAVENEFKEQTAQQTRGRAILVLLLIFFLVPSVVVMLMIKYDWKPKGSSHGELIQPPVALAATGEGTNIWLDKWHVVYMDAACEAGCVEKLKALRNLHVSMYKNMLRVKLVLVTERQNVEGLQASFPELVIVNEPSMVDQSISAFAVDQADPFSAGNLYFVDPLGFLVMRFSPEIPLKKVRSDLVKLLKFAWAG